MLASAFFRMPANAPIVFIVDDDVSVRESVELLVRHEGSLSVTFSSADDFLERPSAAVPMMELNGLPRQKSASAVRTLAAAERDHILEVLGQTSWLIGGQKGAAALLGLPRTTLIYRMRKLGIESRRSGRRQWSPAAPRALACGAV
ncbi:MAG: helix-turn-helix domain-containing protein [Bryobacteraceae bacterium]